VFCDLRFGARAFLLGPVRPDVIEIEKTD